MRSPRISGWSAAGKSARTAFPRLPLPCPILFPQEVLHHDSPAAALRQRRLLAEERAGRVTLRRYWHTPACPKLVASHITDRLIRLDINPEHCMERDPWFAAHYPELIRALAAVMDDHLLS